MRTKRSYLQGGIALILATIAPSAWAATYEVGPNKTYKNLSEVASQLKPGDVVEIQGNATYPGNIRLRQSGTADKKITIRGIRVSGKRPVLSGGTNTLEIQGNHYIVEGLDITNGSSRCYYHHGHDITMRDTVIHDCPSHGILGADSDSGSLTLEYSEVYRTGDGDRRHQIYMATDERAHPGAVFRMQHTFVHSPNGGNNVKSRAERNEIYYNWVEGSRYHELELIGPDGTDPNLKREDSDVVGNVLRKTSNFWAVRFGGDGTGDTKGRYRFVNNTVILQSGSSGVFRLFDGIESLEAHNNVFYAPGNSSFRVLEEGSAKWATGRKVAGQNNWVLSSATQVPSEWSGTLKGNHPGLVSLDGFNLKPTADSPLVNAGAENHSGPSGHPFPNPLAAPLYHPPARKLEAPGSAEARPKSGRIDIGAYEYLAPGAGDGGAGGAGGSGGDGDGDGGSGGAPQEPGPGDDGQGGSGGDPQEPGPGDDGQGGSGDIDPGAGGAGGEPGEGGGGSIPEPGDGEEPPATGGPEAPADEDGGVSCQIANPGVAGGSASALALFAAAYLASRRRRSR